jgi:DNA-directed RNA polymerase subunit RPC12/RpoP
MQSEALTMELRDPYVCSWCGGTRGFCLYCNASVHTDEFFPGIGCIVCSQSVRIAVIDRKLQKEGR